MCSAVRCSRALLRFCHRTEGRGARASTLSGRDGLVRRAGRGANAEGSLLNELLGHVCETQTGHGPVPSLSSEAQRQIATLRPKTPAARSHGSLLRDECPQLGAVNSGNVALRALQGPRRLELRNGTSCDFLRCSSDNGKLILRHVLEGP